MAADFVWVLLPKNADFHIRLELSKGPAVIAVEWLASLTAAYGPWLHEWLG